MNTPIPEVSIVTPTYNRARLLLRAWNSLKDQKPTFEWIVVDDGSKDNTAEVITGLGDPRILFLPLERNRGVNYARNYGAMRARAPLVIYLDSDDEIYPASLEMMLTVMRQADPCIGAAFFACVAGNTGKQISIMQDGRVLDERMMLCEDVLQTEMLLIYRREVIEKYKLPEDLKSCEGLFVRAIAQEYKMLMVDKPGRIYHRQDDNISSASSIVGFSHNIAEYYERLLSNHAEVLKDCPAAQRRYLIKMLYRYGVSRRRRQAWNTYRRLLGSSPSVKEVLAGTGMLAGTVFGLTEFEMWRKTRINRRFGY